MPKPPTFPTLYDQVKTLSVSFLKMHGYLNPNQLKAGTVTWSIAGSVTGRISITVVTEPTAPYLELDYSCNGSPVHYRVDLVSKPSNLGRGQVWYFVCPATRKRCRKLYLADTYFYHREAFSGCMYSDQTQSKKTRRLEKTISALFGAEELERELYRKHMKKKYRGKPTKRYLKLVTQIEQARSIDIRVLEMALIR